EPAFGTSGGRAARRLVGLEQLELPGVAGIPQRGTAARATAADGGLAVHRAEARVVELAGGRVQAARGTPDPEHAPPPGPGRSLDARRRPHLGVVRRARDLKPRPDQARPAVRVRQLGRDDVHHAAQRIRSVQHAGGPADHLDALCEPGVHGGAILVAPRVVLQAAPIGEHQDARACQSPNHRLADLCAGATGAKPTWRTITVYCPEGRSARTKAPSAPVVATRCSSETSTVAVGRGEPARSVTRPERVSASANNSESALSGCIAVTIPAGAA